MRVTVFVLLLLGSLGLHAAIEERSFANDDQAELYQTLLEELRCLVCQNQNLAASNADLAQDLREQAYEMVAAGQSYDEITDFMVERYGDFVLYRPPVKAKTLLLWGGPFLLLIIGLFIAFQVIRQRGESTPAGQPGHYTSEQVKELLRNPSERE